MDERVLELERRLHRVERRNRRLVWGGLVVLAGFVVFSGARPATTQDLSGTVRAPLRVVDGSGDPLLEVASDQNGAYLRLFNPQGRAVARLWADAAGGNFYLYDKAGKIVGAFFTRDDGAGGEVQVRNGEGKVVGAMFSRDDLSGGELKILNSDGKSIGVLFARKDGVGGELQVNNRDGKSVGAMFAGPDNGNLAIYDKNGKEIYGRP